EQGEKNEWTFGDITPDVAIKGFGGATLLSAQPFQTIQLLQEQMGLEKIAEENGIVRLKTFGDIGNIIDVKISSSGRGTMGVGTVHHIAWRAKDDEDQLEWKKYMESFGYGMTPVRKRNYFNAIYFREHGGILFEIATDPPGFAHDESYETMGEKLQLPSQYEEYRAQLNKRLIPIEVRTLDDERMNTLLELNPTGLTERENYKLLIGSIIPRPIAFVTSMANDGTVNGAPFSYFNVVSSNPPMISLSIQRRDGALKDTAKNILENRE